MDMNPYVCRQEQTAVNADPGSAADGFWYLWKRLFMIFRAATSWRLPGMKKPDEALIPSSLKIPYAAYSFLIIAVFWKKAMP